jgi:hypothetical protein
MPVIPKITSDSDSNHQCVKVTRRAARNDALIATFAGLPLDPTHPIPLRCGEPKG